jgi:predicted SprT family Zn-dependent metalloprotease
MIEGCSLITVAEAKALEAEVERICKEFDTPNNIELEISKRMKLSAGRWEIKCQPGIGPMRDRIKVVKIKLSHRLYKDFGFDRLMKTLKHEMAHHINYVVYEGDGHDYNFKKLCAKFGGSMAPKMAGSRFADCATAEYCKRKSGYRYTCPTCGESHEKSRPWTPEAAKRRLCGKCRTNVSLFMMEEI